VTVRRPIKVLRLIARLNTGGPAIHTILLTRGLSCGRFTSRLVTGVVGAEEGDMMYYSAERGVRPLVLPELGRKLSPLNDLKALRTIYRLVASEQPDIVHTHTTKAGLVGRLAVLLSNAIGRWRGRRPAKLVHTFHGHVFHGYFPKPISLALVTLERALARRTDRVVTVSNAIRRDLVERYRICPAEKATVVPLGFDFRWVSAIPGNAGYLKTKCGVPRGVVTVGVVGRLTGIKNHALLIAAMASMGRNDVWALIVGDGELRATLERAAAESGVGTRVVFAGWQQEPAAIYADLDVVCLTSRNEGTPVALIEAMAAGRPIVATRVGGVPDLMVGAPVAHPDGFEVFNNGILVPPDDARALAAAVAHLADRPALRRAMGAAGRAMAVDRFGKERLFAAMETIYDEVLGTNGGRE